MFPKQLVEFIHARRRPTSARQGRPMFPALQRSDTAPLSTARVAQRRVVINASVGILGLGTAAVLIYPKVVALLGGTLAPLGLGAAANLAQAVRPAAARGVEARGISRQFGQVIHMWRRGSPPAR